MATKRQKFTAFSEMPEALQNFLYSDDFTNADDVLQKTYNLSDDQKVVLGDKVMDAVFNDATVVQAIADLKAAFVPATIPEIQWPQFLGDLIKLEFWALRDLLGDELKQVMSENKVSTAGWPTFRVLLKPLTYGGAASEIATMVGFVLAGPMRERLRDLIISKIKGVRIDSQVKEMLVRQSDFGGLGFDSGTADKVLAAMNMLMSSVKIMNEDEYADWLAEESRKKLQAETPKAPASEDDKEIEAIRAKMPQAPAAPQSALDEAVESVFAGISDKPTDEYLVKRLRYVISSRLRDVRSELELRGLLQRDTKVGGLGMSRETSERIAKQIEEGYKTFHQRILEEEKSRLDEQLIEQKQKVEERKVREAEEHARWYREKILVRKQEEEEKQVLATRMRQSMTVGPTNPIDMHPIDIKERKTETARFGELVSATASGVAAEPAKPTKMVQNAAPLLGAGEKEATPAAPQARPEVKVSKATVEIATAAAALKPRLDDVKFAGPRLTGPVQELKSLTLSEFRRLAKDPQVAMQKVLQKIEVLGQESFERRVEGIKAFQASGLQQIYMSLVAESFRKGKPVIQLAEDKRAGGEDAPSPEELSAIISLNSKLHF